MKTRFLPVTLALSTVLCLAVPVFTQGRLQRYPVKFGPLESGDGLRISLFKEPYLVTGSDRMDLTFNVVVGNDGRMRMSRASTNPLAAGNTPRPLADVLAVGLTIPQLRQVLERRIAENNYETRVSVFFTGSNALQ